MALWRPRCGLLLTCVVLGSGIATGYRAQAEAPTAVTQTVQVGSVRFTDHQTVERTVVGEILVDAQDGGIMIQGEDGRIWTIQPEQIRTREKVTREFIPASAKVVGDKLRQELGPGFNVRRTQHYVLVYNCDDVYAQRVAALFEALYKSFFAYWRNQKWELDEPRFPLVAVVLKDHASFLNHARKEIGNQAENVIGYYNLASNQMTTFDVPSWERNVSTIIHEATHQLAYNCGMQKRFADNPTWVSEGLAMFFEAPDRRNPRKWRAVGRVNQVNLARWKDYQSRRDPASLRSLLQDDKRFQDASTATDAYGEGWALTYFLIKTQRKKYVDYLRQLSQGRPLMTSSPEQRIELFEQTFRGKLEQLDEIFVKFMRRVR